MYKFNIVLLFYILGTIYLVESNDPVTIYEQSVEAQNAAQSLETIQSNEALPLVLFKHRRENKLHLPTKLDKVRLLDGKMIHGTEFIYESGTEQIFFCPGENTTEKCLVPKISSGVERLRCTSEATPVIPIELYMRKCGENQIGTVYNLTYRICRTNEFHSRTDEIEFYEICYDKENQKTLYTIHPILSPELLNAKLLLRERELDYRMMTNDEFYVLRSLKPDDESSEINPGYQWQKLVSPKDMALGSWRRTTFLEANTALQHEKLMDLWDKIGEYVRSNAIKMRTENDISTLVHTGVFDVDSAHRGEQLSNIWIKFILTRPRMHGGNFVSKGLTIMMDNFVGTETSPTTSLDSEAIRELCPQDMCIETLSNEFKQIKGRVRCCLVTEKIIDMFDEDHFEIAELRIPNVNVTEDQGN